MKEDKKLINIFNKYGIETGETKLVVDKELKKECNILVYNNKPLPDGITKEFTGYTIHITDFDVPSNSNEIDLKNNFFCSDKSLDFLKETNPNLEYELNKSNSNNDETKKWFIKSNVKVFKTYSYYQKIENSLDEIEVEFKLKNETEKTDALNSIASSLLFFKVLAIIGLILAGFAMVVGLILMYQ